MRWLFVLVCLLVACSGSSPTPSAPFALFDEIPLDAPFAKPMPWSPNAYFDADLAVGFGDEWIRVPPVGPKFEVLGILGEDAPGTEDTNCLNHSDPFGFIGSRLNNFSIENPPVSAASVQTIEATLRTVYSNASGTFFQVSLEYYTGATFLGALFYDLVAETTEDTYATITKTLAVTLTKAEADALRCEVRGEHDGSLGGDSIRIGWVRHRYEFAFSGFVDEICVDGDVGQPEADGVHGVGAAAAGDWTLGAQLAGGVGAIAVSGEWSKDRAINGSVPECEN